MKGWGFFIRLSEIHTDIPAIPSHRIRTPPDLYRTAAPRKSRKSQNYQPLGLNSTAIKYPNSTAERSPADTALKPPVRIPNRPH